MTVSIIIPAYNRNNDLACVLSQLQKQSCTDFEVVIVDDGSSPPVADAIAVSELPYPVALVRHHRRRGIAAARNSGIAAAHWDLLIFIDSDAAILDSDWLQKFLQLYKEAAQLADREDCPSFVFHSEVFGISTTCVGKVDTYANWLGSCMKMPCRIRDRHVPMNNTGMHRTVFDTAGLFDEAFHISEDIEWGFRCLEKKTALFFIPGAPVGHYDRNTIRGVWNHYFQFGEYTPKVRGKHPAAPRSWLYPKTCFQAIWMFLPLTILKTAYIVLQWLPQSPKVLAYTPGIFLANVASYLGMCKTLASIKSTQSS